VAVTESTEPEVGQTYRIGAVARLTGIPPDTLRVWERRYAVVTPVRSEAGTRLYRAEDVSRLNLIKRLVDNGDAISHVARLSLEHLRQRAQGLDTPAPTSQETRPCRVAVLGPSLPMLLQSAGVGLSDDASDVQFAGLYTEESSFRDHAGQLGLDLLVLECPTIHDDQLRHLADLAARSGAPRTLVVYSYASRDVVNRLEAQHIVAKRAPVDAVELKRWCVAMHGAATAAAPALLGDFDLSEPPPARLYDTAALSRIAAASPTVKCECPHHLVQLVSSLVAFEAYSRECENRNADDAALHAFLHAATAQARATMETALARVVEAEGIDI
jgi:DNA-binding transcriptional MerR regulator